MLPAFKLIPVCGDATSITSASANIKVLKPANSPAVAFVPFQIVVSILAATLAATCAIKKSAKVLGNVLNAE